MSAVWMYRKGEAKLFASPDQVPAGEGWVDSPSKANELPPAPKPIIPKRKRAGDGDGA